MTLLFSTLFLAVWWRRFGRYEVQTQPLDRVSSGVFATRTNPALVPANTVGSIEQNQRTPPLSLTTMLQSTYL